MPRLRPFPTCNVVFIYFRQDKEGGGQKIIAHWHGMFYFFSKGYVVKRKVRVGHLAATLR
jgi:hypothetical protein